MSYKGRDVEVVQINNKESLVIACDSCGGIGKKERDVVKASPYIVGETTTRVALMELLAVNAIPKSITLTIASEPYPTGDEIIKGAKEELEASGYKNLPMAISTEKNIPTCQTALGITLIGLCNNASLRICTSKAEDEVYCLGRPLVGNEVLNVQASELITPKDIKALSSMEGIHDIIPVGSKGILGEIELLCKSNDYTFISEAEVSIDMNKSAGPSTCLIFTASKEVDLSSLRLKPLKIGKLTF
ncbi:AIR synthase related protein [Alloiococcus sp. CFN-8]|uniref:AIR synthase related protein n=1 Tax=Alloiococcus sp. CFN-8 TaxID=3416081 RepID=UPI003CE67F74